MLHTLIEIIVQHFLMMFSRDSLGSPTAVLLAVHERTEVAGHTADCGQLDRCPRHPLRVHDLVSDWTFLGIRAGTVWCVCHGKSVIL